MSESSRTVLRFLRFHFYSHNHLIHILRIKPLSCQLVSQLHEAIADELSFGGGQQDGVFSLWSEKHVQHLPSP